MSCPGLEVNTEVKTLKGTLVSPPHIIITTCCCSVLILSTDYEVCEHFSCEICMLSVIIDNHCITDVDDEDLHCKQMSPLLNTAFNVTCLTYK